MGWMWTSRRQAPFWSTPTSEPSSMFAPSRLSPHTPSSSCCSCCQRWTARSVHVPLALFSSMLHAASDLTSPISDRQSWAVQRVILLLDQTVHLFIHFVFQYKFYLLDSVQPKRTKKIGVKKSVKIFLLLIFFLQIN